MFLLTTKFNIIIFRFPSVKQGIQAKLHGEQKGLSIERSSTIKKQQTVRRFVINK